MPSTAVVPVDATAVTPAFSNTESRILNEMNRITNGHANDFVVDPKSRRMTVNHDEVPVNILNSRFNALESDTATSSGSTRFNKIQNNRALTANLKRVADAKKNEKNIDGGSSNKKINRNVVIPTAAARKQQTQTAATNNDALRTASRLPDAIECPQTVRPFRIASHFRNIHQKYYAPFYGSVYGGESPSSPKATQRQQKNKGNKKKATSDKKNKKNDIAIPRAKEESLRFAPVWMRRDTVLGTANRQREADAFVRRGKFLQKRQLDLLDKESAHNRAVEQKGGLEQCRRQSLILRELEAAQNGGVATSIASKQDDLVAIRSHPAAHPIIINNSNWPAASSSSRNIKKSGNDEVPAPVVVRDASQTHADIAYPTFLSPNGEHVRVLSPDTPPPMSASSDEGVLHTQ